MLNPIKGVFFIMLYISLWFIWWPAAALWTAVALVRVAMDA